MNSVKSIFKALLCKHKTFVNASCPFTGYTYTDCEKCGKRIKAEKTNG